MWVLVPFLTTLLLVLALIVVLQRALDYLKLHPELVTNGTPLAYQRCQGTLRQVIQRYRDIVDHVTLDKVMIWPSPNGNRYTISAAGIEEHRQISPDSQKYALPWDDIGGVGIRMQPGFTLADRNRDGLADSQFTSGYTFHMLIVPISGKTMNILIPTDERPDAVDFAAHTIALAERMDKRINVFGFDKPPAPHRQRVSKI